MVDLAARSRRFFIVMLNQPIQVLKQTELIGHQFTVYGTAENPLFLAKEVAECIGHSNITVMLQTIDEDEKVKVSPKQSLGELVNYKEYNFLTEDGLYEVLMQSRKPIAKQFKKGVKQILHEVRTTGGYIATHQDDTPEEIMARALTIAQATLSKREERLKQLEAQTEQQQATIKIQTEEIKQAAPKNRFSFGNLRNCCIFAVLTVRQTLLLRRAAVNCSMVIGHFLCSIFKDIRRLSIRSHYCFVLRSKVCWTVSSVYGNRFSVAYNDLNAYSHGK